MSRTVPFPQSSPSRPPPASLSEDRSGVPAHPLDAHFGGELDAYRIPYEVSDTVLPSPAEGLLQALMEIGQNSRKRCAYRDPLHSHRVCNTTFERMADLVRHICVTHRNAEMDVYMDGKKTFSELPALVISIICALYKQPKGLWERGVGDVGVLRERVRKWCRSGDMDTPLDLTGLEQFEKVAISMVTCWRKERTCDRCGGYFSREDALARHRRENRKCDRAASPTKPRFGK
jgi:hypothetical protein